MFRILTAFLLIYLTFSQVSHAEGKKYALVVGVEKYRPSQLARLQFAEDDAIALGESLKNLGFDVVVMTGQADNPDLEPSYADDILNQLKRRVSGRSGDDTILVAMSGHGVQLKQDSPLPDGTKETYFCPERSDLRDKSTLLPMSEVVTELKKCAARRKILLVDACRNEVEPKDVAGKDSSPVEIELDPAGVTRRTIPHGMVALFSCSSSERSYELANLGHSVFTYHVLQYLNGKADRYPDRQIGIGDFAAYVSRETRDYIDGRLSKNQTPELLLPEGRLSDWNLGQVPFDTSAVGSRPGQIRSVSSVGMKLIWCPAGKFESGGHRSYQNDERGVDVAGTEVAIKEGFWIGKFEVTQKEWTVVMPRSARDWLSNLRFPPGPDGIAPDLPMTSITRQHAQRFCEELTRLERSNGHLPEGWIFRLPTDIEWEYACRATTTTNTAFGNRLRPEQANFSNLWDSTDMTAGEPRDRPMKVGSFPPNKWGIYDCHGNVAEWCSTDYRRDIDTYIKRGLPMFKGGCFCDYGYSCQSGNPAGGAGCFVDPWQGIQGIGMRVVLALE